MRLLLQRERLAGLVIFVALIVLAGCEPHPVGQVRLPAMRPIQCHQIAQYLFWVADYRDVKADKKLLKERMKGPKELLDFMNEEVDRIYAGKESGEDVANAFMARCLAPRQES